DESARERLLRGEHAAGVRPLGGLCDADQPGQEPGAARLRHDAAPGEHEPDRRRARRDPDVHGQREGDAEADGRPVDGRDDRLRHLVDPQRDESAAVAVLLRRLAPALARAERRAASPEVGAGAEGPAGAGHDDRPHAVVRIRAIEGGDELLDHGRVDGVEALRPVQRDRGHAVVDLVAQRLERHQNPSARRSRPAPAATGSAAAGPAAMFSSAGMTSAAKRRMLRSASSYGMPAYEKTPTKWLLPVRRWMSTMRS